MKRQLWTKRVWTMLALFSMACGSVEKPSDDAGTAPDDAGGLDGGPVLEDGGATDAGGLTDAAEPGDTAAPVDTGTIDAGPADGGLDMAADASVDGGSPDMGSACTRTGFAAVEQSAVFDVPNDQFLYTAFSSNPQRMDPYAFISFEVYPYLGGAVEPQTYDFPGVNYADCSTCLLVFADCMRPQGCQTIFLVESGTAVVTAADTMNGAPFQATFNDVVLREVTIDTDTFESTPVPGGESWCIDNFPANTLVEVMN